MPGAGSGSEELQACLLDGNGGGARDGAEMAADASRGRTRSRHVGLCGCLRWARRELLGFGALVAAGVVLGLALPTDPKLTDPAVARVSNVLGWLYFVSWTVSFYPQVCMCVD